MSPKLTIGLTGGIGSGKSAVALCFTSLGIHVVNADIAARRVVEKGSQALEQIAEHFGNKEHGQDILDTEGNLNRAKLRAIVFADEAERRWLEALLHPLIGDWIRQALAQTTSPYAVLESPLLLETHQHQMVDRILVVDVPEETQRQRAAARDGNTEEQVRAIMAAQIPRQARLAKADDVLDNSGTLVDLEKQVDRLHRQYLEILKQISPAPSFSKRGEIE